MKSLYNKHQTKKNSVKEIFFVKNESSYNSTPPLPSWYTKKNNFILNSTQWKCYLTKNTEMKIQ